MLPHRVMAALPFLLSLQAATTTAQQQPERLTTGHPIEGTVAAGQARTYLLPLDSGRFAAGVAVQDGIDFQLIVIGPAGDTLGKFDSPNGTQGPEPFQVISRARGAHRVVIAPLPEATGSGRYTLTLTLVQPVARTPAAEVDQLMFARGPTDPGAVVAVVRGGKMVYQKAWGLANLTHGVPFTLQTRTNIGSTSKQFTAFAILRLAGQGKLSLDDDVRKHIPELPDLGTRVTLRHLLSHTSGYREFLNTLAMAGRRLDEGDYIDRNEIIGIVQRQPALQNQPGAEFNYNNTGYALLSMIVERVGGKPFPQWMEENVFRPIGMTSTGVRPRTTAVLPGSAQGYAADPAGGWREVADIGGSWGAGGIYTTVGDLALWLRNFHTQQVGAPNFLQQMTTRYVLTGGDTTGYGMGLFVDRWRGLERFQHGGADAAHRSQLIYFPELDAGVIVDSNDAAFNASATADQVAGFFFADRAATPPAVAAGSPARAAPFEPEKFDAYVGRYELEEMPGYVVAFMRDGTRLLTQGPGQPQIELTATSDSTFTVKGVQASVTFHRDAAGAVTSLTLHQNGNHPARRLDPASPAAKPDLTEYAGRYFSAELEAFYDLKAEGDSLVARGRHTLPVTLRYGSGESFTGAMPLVTVKFGRNAQGSVSGFRAGSGRTRDVLFIRQ